MIQQLTIIGVGLIGGSLARALKEANACGEVVGCGRNEAELKKAQQLGVIDRYSLDPAEAVVGADVVLLAVPLSAMRSVMSAIAPSISETTILTDVGSAKASVVNDAMAVFGKIPDNFLPAHPIAGTEKSGVEASFPALFQNHKVILTPLKNSSKAALSRVTAMWQCAGAEVVEMSVEHHDRVLAATSHLPHILAYALVGSLARMDETDEIFQYAAGGFRDFTRIASSDAQMWHDICLANRKEVLNVLERFRDDLDALTVAFEANDGAAVLDCFSRAKRARDHFSTLIAK
ncbi:MAG: prephenate dehydrogenase/arogenate dehydrogenase family protein [Gammaproteobacteria bacterium]|nr:prephenate dehydrogenase/arogenate dehydrogenase family protein [Gammaproteobacteria bacterium]MCF6231233.1 prephenate dehydrogenase/arogenate dehydrogenase family protein [Gammaproteobacteria bacterium]